MSNQEYIPHMANSELESRGQAICALAHGRSLDPVVFLIWIFLYDSYAGEGGSMPLIQLVIVLVVIGVLLWLVNNYIPMDGKIKKILNGAVVICVVVWLLFAFGVLNHSGDIRVPRLQ